MTTAAPDRQKLLQALHDEHGLTFADVVEFFSKQQDDNDKRLISLARDEWVRDGEIEIDENAIVSVSEDRGAYISAWVWVYDPLRADEDDETSTPDVPTTGTTDATALVRAALLAEPLAQEFRRTIASAWENRLVNHHRSDLPDDILAEALEDTFDDLLENDDPAATALRDAVSDWQQVDWEALAADLKGHPNDFL